LDPQMLQVWMTWLDRLDWRVQQKLLRLLDRRMKPKLLDLRMQQKLLNRLGLHGRA
jgi:hypothetical protein